MVTKPKPRDFPYGVLIESEDAEEGQLWGYEVWGDGHSCEKRMDDIIITAANYASAPGGANEGQKHYTWCVLDPIEEPKRAKG